MLTEEIGKMIKGEVAIDEKTLEKYSRDASLFEIKPEAVVFPKDAEDVKKLVNFVAANKRRNKKLSLTPRAGGSDMTGGPLTESIVVDFKHFNRIRMIGDDCAVAEPGVFYRDFEKETLKRGLILPTYPASREMCALGGMVANNAGGEKNLKYGKTVDYVEEIKAVLADGQEYVLKPLPQKELAKKIKGKSFESRVYREVFQLIKKNYEIIKKARPNVSKNSAGYNLWDVWNGSPAGDFDLTKLFVGSQGTLGLITETKFRLVPAGKYSGLLVIFMRDLKALPAVIDKTLATKPASFESFDEHTFTLALKFFTGFLKAMGAANIVSLGLQFLPEFFHVLLHGMPKMILLAEFEEESQEEVNRKIRELKRALKPFKLSTKSAPDEAASRKYWVMRRESFNLLRHKVKGLKTAPFIDDIIVRPEYLWEFLPKLYEILNRYQFLYTVAGHVGDGNFHIIPLMNFDNKSQVALIPQAADEVYDLVLQYGGSLTAEHNDGLIRGAYLKKMYGPKIYALFRKIKNIFDPQGIFNPGKKIGTAGLEKLLYKYLRKT